MLVHHWGSRWEGIEEGYGIEGGGGRQTNELCSFVIGHGGGSIGDDRGGRRRGHVTRGHGCPICEDAVEGGPGSARQAAALLLLLVVSVCHSPLQSVGEISRAR